MLRREFLRDGLLTAGSVLAASRFTLARATQVKRKIIVIGAGLSGLVAAYELKKLGHDVTILEAQDRPGGRVLTLRGFSEGHWADAGAARIPGNHDLTRRYIKEFALDLIPFYPTQHRFLRVRDNRPEPVEWSQFARSGTALYGIDHPAEFHKIKGGNDHLPRAFADRLKQHIRYNSPAQAIEQDDNGARVRFTENGRAQTISGDHVVAAIPATVLRGLQFSPALPEAKVNALNRANYDSASRVFIETKSRFWLDQQLNGFGDGRNGVEMWDSTFGEDGTGGILQSYSRGSYSMALTRQQPEQRVEATLSEFEFFYPTIRRHFVRGASKCWSEDPWAKGAWAYLDGSVAISLAMPFRRISFCGEHLSFTPGWMQGALQSGLRVVDAITRERAARPATA